MNNKILVIDDNDYITSTLKMSIEKEGYQVHTKENGKEALDWLTENPVDLIITDINMPEMDGFEFMGHLKKDEGMAKIPVLILTTQVDSKEKARESGAKGYLIKPFSSKKLISTIKKILP
jgi:two-component system, chemotaxis family, chemotaxis protein CheY